MNNYKYIFQIFISIKIIFFFVIYLKFGSSNFGDEEQYFNLTQGSISDYIFNLKIWYYELVLNFKTEFDIEYKNLKTKVFPIQLVTQFFHKVFSYNAIITNLFFYILFCSISFQFFSHLKNKSDMFIFFFIIFSPLSTFYSSYVGKEIFFNIFLLTNILVLHSKINIKFKILCFFACILVLGTLRFEIALIYIIFEIIYISYKKNLINGLISSSIFYLLCLIIFGIFISKYLYQIDFLISNQYRLVFYGSDETSNLWNLNNHNIFNFIINFFWGFFSNYTSFFIDRENSLIDNLLILYGLLILIIQFFILLRLYNIYRYKYFIIFFIFFTLLHVIVFFVASYNLGHKARIFNNIYYIITLYPLLIINKSEN